METGTMGRDYRYQRIFIILAIFAGGAILVRPLSAAESETKDPIPPMPKGYENDDQIKAAFLAGKIELVVTDDGMPLGYEVFAGNRNDSTTVEEIVAAAGETTIADHLEAESPLERLGRPLRGLLPAANQPQRDGSGGALETLHPIDRGGMGVSDYER